MGSIGERKTFFVEDELEIIRRIKNGERQSDICKEFSLSKYTVGTIWKNRSLLISAYEKNLNNDKKLRSSSGTTSRDEEKKQNPIPLEPTVVIKEEPVDYDPTPSTSAHGAKEEFILPHEENTWSAPSTTPMQVSPNPVETTQFIPSIARVSIASAPVFTFSVAKLAPSNVPGSSDGEPLKKKRKVKTKPSATFTPTASIVPAALSPAAPIIPATLSTATSLVPATLPSPATPIVPVALAPTANSVVVKPPSPGFKCGELSDSGALAESRKDQFDVFGEYVAAKLRSLDRRSCAFAQKAIGDVIFDAEMGKYLNGESKCAS